MLRRTSVRPVTREGPMRATMTMRSPIGMLDLCAEDDQLVELWLPDRADPARDRAADRAVPAGHRRSAVLQLAAAQLTEYFAGQRRDFDLPLAPQGTDFQREVWRALAQIPFGITCSYGELARAIGRPAASRAVGAANGRNPIAIILPCHRVIGASGELTGYGGGLPMKRWLLDHERACVQPALPGLGDPPVVRRTVRR
jgi:methylated-DNA-[protein]-cysteine S-methyltransferase